MFYLILKCINPDTRIFVSKLKYDIDTSTLASVVNNVKCLIDDMSSNYLIIVDKVELRDYYGRHMLGVILAGPN